MSRPTISTRTGDAGKTGLFGGQRISKDSHRLHAYGTVDELNSILGVVLAEPGIPQLVVTHLEHAQGMLFTIGADLATPLDSDMQVDRLSENAVTEVELQGHTLEKELEQLKHFVLPGGSKVGALLHQARTVCRRAERWVVALEEKEEINDHVRVYINRLSDYLFLAARYVNKEMGVEEAQWHG